MIRVRQKNVFLITSLYFHISNENTTSYNARIWLAINQPINNQNTTSFNIGDLTLYIRQTSDVDTTLEFG